MSATTRAKLKKHFARVTPRDRDELKLLVAGVAILILAVVFSRLASEVIKGDTLNFDKQLLASLRDPADTSRPIGPRWLVSGALDITALGSATVLGLAVIGVTGFLLLQGMWRMGLFVFVACSGAWFINAALKQVFQRPRPDVVPHLREAMTMSFPSGHALTSAVVYLTLGALLMRVAKRPLTKWYCMGVAAAATFLVGASRVYLGVHYPTDVIAGWVVGLSWALLCWLVERSLERRAGLKRERAEAG